MEAHGFPNMPFRPDRLIDRSAQIASRYAGVSLLTFCLAVLGYIFVG